jgi:polyhydroxybutyrate depolymerase
MVLMFHGFGSNGREFASLTRIATRASARGDVAVIPDGPNHTWQLTGRGSDAAFVDTIVNDVETTLCIDRHRVDAAGFSQGAAFAILYGCARPGRIAAIATVAVDLQLGCHAPMPYLAFHGTRDPAVPFDNGAVGASLPGVRMRGTLLNLHDWAQLDRCHPTPTVSALAPQVRRTTWSGCAAGTAVQLYTVIGGSHTWPGADPRKGFGLTTQQLDATVTMLGFFAAHRIG